MSLKQSLQFPIPFEDIALSLSGGGYRATAYHLGLLSYLNHANYKEKPLLENVKIISAISGGSITAAMYALQLAQGNGMQGTFDRLYELLTKDQLVALALDKLNHPAHWNNPHKTKDLINAFSEVYNEVFYNGATFQDLRHTKWHLSDLILGATEFTNGLQFRLLQSESDASFGNGKLEIPQSISKDILLADAVAASSCFPGGFEPMIMPRDFSNSDQRSLQEYWTDKSKTNPLYQPTGIMDGGIVDNLGIESVLLAENRYSGYDKSNPIIGTFIISDVSSQRMEPLEIPELKDSKFKNLITTRILNWLAVIMIIAGSTTLILIHNRWATALAIVLMTISVVWLMIFRYSNSIIKEMVQSQFGQRHVPEILKDLRVVQRTPIYILLYLIQFRIRSVLKMVLSVFLRRIKALQLKNLFSDNYWNYRAFANDIHVLADSALVSSKLKPFIALANTMPTTLWFSEKEKEAGMLDAIIICGQVNICYNMIRYIDKLKKHSEVTTYKVENQFEISAPTKHIWNSLTPEQQAAINALYKTLKQDWERFSQNPRWLLDQYSKK